MNRVPRWYQRIEFVNNEYSKLENFLNKTNLDFEDKQTAVDLIKNFAVLYWRFLKDILKESNITEYYPRKIIQKATKENLINKNQLCWIEYIDILNELLYAQEKKRIELTNKIFDKYIDEVFYAHKIINELAKNTKVSEEKQCNELPYNKPIYSCKELGISENSYNLLMDFFVNTTFIKTVWLHGSRAKNTYRFSSDIDLIADFPYEQTDEVCDLLKSIRIPYIVDCTSIYDPYNKTFVQKVANYAKVIYRNIDFNIYA